MAIQLDVDHNITNTAKNIDESAWNVNNPNDPFTDSGQVILTRFFNELVINIRFIINLNIINKTY